jgi:hypothetical protein
MDCKEERNEQCRDLAFKDFIEKYKYKKDIQ